MDVDEDDDFYGADEPETKNTPPADVPAVAPKVEQDEDLEEGEEEDEGGAMDEDSDSDIDIITERKDVKTAPPSTSKYSEIRNIPQRTTSSDGTLRPAQVKMEDTKDTKPKAAPVSASQVDINAIPTHKGTGKPLTQVNIDEDLPDNDKPWRTPGTDLSDYFNYGFDEFTWTLYAQKQEDLRSEYNQGAITQSQKKMMEDMNSMMMMGGMPGLGGMPGAAGAGGAAAGGASAMPGMEGMPPEMQAMMQQMMGSGVDPSHMDPGAMAAMFAGMQGGAQAGGQGGQGQNFGGGGGGYGGGQGQGQGQGQNYGGYDQQGHGHQSHQGRGGFRGRGRGRGNW